MRRMMVQTRTVWARAFGVRLFGSLRQRLMRSLTLAPVTFTGPFRSPGAQLPTRRMLLFMCRTVLCVLLSPLAH